VSAIAARANRLHTRDHVGKHRAFATVQMADTGHVDDEADRSARSSDRRIAGSQQK
jgi:hypothetical protein